MTIITKFFAAKLGTVLAAGLIFLLLWGVVATSGWSGAEPSVELPPDAAYPLPPPEPGQVIIQHIIVTRRVYQKSGGPAEPGSLPPAPASAPEPAVPMPAVTPAPAAPPPPAPAPTPQPPNCPNKTPMACSRPS